MNTDAPLHRSILIIDVENSTVRTNPAKGDLRRQLYRMVEDCLLMSQISADQRDPLMDRGDGICAVIHPEVAKTRLLDTVVPLLGDLLVGYAARDHEHALRMRAAVHAGEVHYDANGCYGEAVDVAFRLVNMPALKKQLRRSDHPLALVTSDLIYDTIIRHGYAGIDRRLFTRVGPVAVAQAEHFGWVYRPEGVDEVDRAKVIDVGSWRAFAGRRPPRRNIVWDVT